MLVLYYPIWQKTLTVYGGYGVRDHLFPFRTESLSLTAPMVLGYTGRVGRRHFSSPAAMRGFFFALYFQVNDLGLFNPGIIT